MIGLPARMLSVTNTIDRDRSLVEAVETQYARREPVADERAATLVRSLREQLFVLDEQRGRGGQRVRDVPGVVGEREDRDGRTVEDRQADPLTFEAGGQGREAGEHVDVELDHRAGHVEAQHDVPVRDLTVVAMLAQRSHREPDRGEPDERQRGDLDPDERPVTAPQPLEHGRRLGVEHVGDRRRVVLVDLTAGRIRRRADTRRDGEQHCGDG